MLSWPPKDPAETLDYDLDWTLRLAGDTIVSSTWVLPAGASLIINSSSFASPLTKVWLSAGVLGQIYTLVNTITTAAGDVMVESVQILSQSK
jgi:hypothetical protein